MEDLWSLIPYGTANSLGSKSSAVEVTDTATVLVILVDVLDLTRLFELRLLGVLSSSRLIRSLSTPREKETLPCGLVAPFPLAAIPWMLTMALGGCACGRSS